MWHKYDPFTMIIDIESSKYPLHSQIFYIGELILRLKMPSYVVNGFVIPTFDMLVQKQRVQRASQEHQEMTSVSKIQIHQQNLQRLQ